MMAQIGLSTNYPKDNASAYIQKFSLAPLPPRFCLTLTQNGGAEGAADGRVDPGGQFRACGSRESEWSLTGAGGLAGAGGPRSPVGIGQ